MPADLIKPLLICLFAALVAAAALKDLTSYTIPNWIPAALAVLFVPAALAVGASPAQIGLALGLGVGMLAAGVVMFMLGWLGGGDAKLMAAASVWIGLPGLAPFVLYTGLAGGALALVLLAARSVWLRPFVAAGPTWIGRLATPGAATPYGVAIALGALAALPAGLIMRAGQAGV
ncbi:MAG TPA: prepilin peptidase [Caulobacteraceae bacterium]|jgi:prepilin peptidase CpaA|nr:prepilin peptidase [Caulobacteraceae bacterium]